MEIKFDELERISQKLATIEKLIIDKGMPNLLPAEKASEKYGIDKQTLDSLSKDKIINKYKLKRRIFYCQKEIDNAIYGGIVRPFIPKPLKK